MITPRRLITGTALTTSWSNALYNVPASVVSATIKQLLICNTDTIPRTFYLAVTPTSTNPATDNDATIMFHAVPLQANETKVFGLTDVVPSGYYIQAKAGEAGSGNYVTITASGMEST